MYRFIGNIKELDLSTYKEDFNRIIQTLNTTQKKALEREIEVLNDILHLYELYANENARIEKLESYDD